MTPYQNIYYLYTHSDPETGEVVYVGQGSKGRAWVYAQGELRRPEHDAFLMDLTERGFTPDAWVTILESSLSKEDSLKKESELIYSLPIYPRFNSKRDHCCKLNSSDLEKIKKLRDVDKLSYYQISLIVGFATMTVFRAYNGRTKNYV